jgi:LysR family transcriptional regulator of abg operon
MKLEQLRHLVAIVAHGSLRAAARRLNMPQPALTRSVRALEREVGAALFVRETTGMVLTPDGQRSAPRVG